MTHDHWLRRWLAHRTDPFDPAKVRASYQRCFASADGQVVLQHLLQTVYCTTYQGLDPQAALVLEARRSVIEEVLFNLEETHGTD